MIKTTRKILALLSIVLICFSCSKDTPVVTPTSLTLTVLDENNNVLSGANVDLYPSENDLINLRNQIGTTQVSNSLGQVTFSGLSPQKYCWLILKGCQSNVNTTYTSVNNLTANVVNQYNVSTTSTGTLKFISNSTNPYKIYLNGNIIFSSFSGGATDYKYFVPTGFHTIRVLQLSGYLFTPTDKTYTGTVTCGANLVTTFPN